MLARSGNVFLSILMALCLFIPASAPKVEAKKKTSFITRLKRKIKRKVKAAVKKTRRGIYKVGAGMTNAVVDGAMKAKVCITGKKNKYTWVKGHYKTGNQHHTSGHFRKISRKKKSSAGSSGGDTGFAPTDTADAPLPFDDPMTGAPAFDAPATDAPADEGIPAVAGGDPVLPSGDDFSFGDDFKYSLQKAAEAKQNK